MSLDIIFILKSIIIAIVEGLTEFIPVSSTGHMILVGSLIDFKGQFAEMFEVVIQLGAILAVVVLYWKKIKDSVIEFFKFIFTGGKEGKTGFKFGINVIVGCIPFGIVGVIFYDNIKALFNLQSVIIGFIVGGILLLVIETLFRKKKHSTDNIDKITPVQALKIGVLQVLSAWPGMSRSASTIMGGWIAGLNSPTAAEFSFFLAIPAMVASSGLDLFEFDYSIMTPTLWIALIVGFIVAFLVSIVVMEKFVNFLKKKPMRVFAIYRIVAGIVLAILAFTNIISI
ncbi:MULTISPECIES: undecaprenyl-diphosphate phosphatase [unclassified Clostridioides]|uniref:undecaprenyl-diphosphate phosphatase n=1 Tax=unclassified Clostridioides TaxID=2635829 RepID=UPI001D12FDF9|nr:undecaprenyl-diphosphate phosphatase [Clostridioides sp. ZZV14-6150]MCC0661618.1 undecaprenyl-diphosphate phosphatase [Clostridioides sp. ZZV14-6154]MCC0668991.1 undecaprenyl-diphosphate phosphatase [Clostridioides sp. ZZV14-6153]MCC0721534.1 undecaprenyl-diphosphate phosphatase [Clostridioides sp. ZZV14-6104]MCC0728513.1 undecaprenyl-diphosphate phosphatase [Clostridioides sp. ZZV14-6045]MCC0731934.1 undecaprenyl-diphosphate phosphatase [Clostridioides sp. ZZV14-6048]MCC0735630.1 undecapr